ncbi:cbb3-type cytochrome c oxidase subunit 3 [Henriciella sp. AS95]|uniref:cbb3-type cytochrome c oxidase subunit 3 n=1 Tax=Henriciella sp. AS95 TaxID=3135782 RepID=UPI0031727F05
MYEMLSSFAQTGGLIYFVILFAGVLAYALWPRNQKRFDDAAALPLSDREPGDE